MYEPCKNSKLLTHQDFGGHICTTINTTTAVQAKKETRLKVSHGQKTPLVACVFHFVLICTYFWLNVNRCTCFWHFLPFLPGVVEYW